MRRRGRGWAELRIQGPVRWPRAGAVRVGSLSLLAIAAHPAAHTRAEVEALALWSGSGLRVAGAVEQGLDP